MATRTYQLTVEGELSDRMQGSFEGMSLERVAGNTVLTGDARDQSELQGLLLRVSALGLVLLKLTTLEPATPRRGSHV
jgi:hypothetical protein